MIVRWTVAAVVDAATRFRRVTGTRDGMVKLVLALRANAVDEHAVESKKRVA